MAIFKYLPILAIAVAAHGTAQAKEVAKFNVATTEISWTLPDRYCLPKGPQVAMAQLLATGDSANITPVTAYSCGAGASDNDYILIKSPAQTLAAEIDRPTLLPALGVEFDKPEFKALMDSGKVLTDSGAALTKTLGTQIDTEGKIGPLGRDDVCAFVGGSMKVSAGTTSSHLAALVCITSVKNKIVSINLYAPYTGPASIAALIPRVRKLADAMIAENEGGKAAK